MNIMIVNFKQTQVFMFENIRFPNLIPWINQWFFLLGPASCCTDQSNESCVALFSSQKANRIFISFPIGTLHRHLQHGVCKAFSTRSCEHPVFAYSDISDFVTVVSALCKDWSLSTVKSTRPLPSLDTEEASSEEASSEDPEAVS